MELKLSLKKYQCNEAKPFCTWLTQKIERWLSRHPLPARIQALYYGLMVKEEINRAAISRKDRVLFVGAGHFPFSAIEIARRTGAKVVAIDTAWQAVSDARKVVKKSGLDKLVEVRHADGRNYSAAGFQVVHIARQAEPWQDIVDNILSTGDVGIKVLRRQAIAESLTGVVLFGEQKLA